MNIIKKSLIVGIAAVLYFCSLWLNEMIWGETEFSFDVHWVFFPSGIRFILVLLALNSGALGIALGGIFWNYLDHPELGFQYALITGCIAGFSPWLARHLSVNFLNLDPNFKFVSPLTLLKISILFATLSAVFHQLWFFYQNLSENFLHSLLVMSASNWIGTLLVLSAFKLWIQSTDSKRGVDP
jgi:hypothetical protein